MAFKNPIAGTIQMIEAIEDAHFDTVARDFFTGNGKIFGFNKESLLEIRRQYLIRKGPVEITPESIKETFQEKE